MQLKTMQVQNRVTELSDHDLLEFPDSGCRKPNFTTWPASPVWQGNEQGNIDMQVGTEAVILKEQMSNNESGSELSIVKSW